MHITRSQLQNSGAKQALTLGWICGEINYVNHRHILNVSFSVLRHKAKTHKNTSATGLQKWGFFFGFFGYFFETELFICLCMCTVFWVLHKSKHIQLQRKHTATLIGRISVNTRGELRTNARSGLNLPCNRQIASSNSKFFDTRYRVKFVKNLFIVTQF